MNLDKKVIGAIASIVLLFAIGGVYFVAKTDKTVQIENDLQVKAVVVETSFDWGEIGIDNGNVEKIFEIKNEGTKPLILRNVITSCMCTTAQLSLDDKVSPVFGMHTKSRYALEVPPQKTVKLKIVFDPAYHGPSGVGPITRQVKVETNDSENAELSFILTATVRR